MSVSFVRDSSLVGSEIFRFVRRPEEDAIFRIEGAIEFDNDLSILPEKLAAHCHYSEARVEKYLVKFVLCSTCAEPAQGAVDSKF